MASTQVELVKSDDTDLSPNNCINDAKQESTVFENDPNFAVICSFIHNFGSYLDLTLDIAKLKSWLEASDTSKRVSYASTDQQTSLIIIQCCLFLFSN